jgi:hypothetical protein
MGNGKEKKSSYPNSITHLLLTPPSLMRERGARVYDCFFVKPDHKFLISRAQEE